MLDGRARLALLKIMMMFALASVWCQVKEVGEVSKEVCYDDAACVGQDNSCSLIASGCRRPLIAQYTVLKRLPACSGQMIQTHGRMRFA
jgi:hypothetical protein